MGWAAVAVTPATASVHCAYRGAHIRACQICVLRVPASATTWSAGPTRRGAAPRATSVCRAGGRPPSGRPTGGRMRSAGAAPTACAGRAR
eukprot:3507795-Pleurochrysis_carterae.AAC.3